MIQEKPDSSEVGQARHRGGWSLVKESQSRRPSGASGQQALGRCRMSEGLWAGRYTFSIVHVDGGVIPCHCGDDQDFVPRQHGEGSLAQAEGSVGKAFGGFPGFAVDK